MQSNNKLPQAAKGSLLKIYITTKGENLDAFPLELRTQECLLLLLPFNTGKSPSQYKKEKSAKTYKDWEIPLPLPPKRKE